MLWLALVSHMPQNLGKSELTPTSPPQMLGWLDESEYSTSTLLTLSNSQFHNNTVYTFSIIYGLSRTLVIVVFNHNLLKCGTYELALVCVG